MTTTGWRVGGVLAAALAVLFALRPPPPGSPPRRGPAIGGSVTASPRPAAALTTHDPVWTLERLESVSSLRGSQADGAIELGFGGRLRPGRGLRDLFDYYLLLIGEVPVPQIRHLLQQDVQGRTGDPGVQAEVMDAFDRYLHLQQMLAGEGVPQAAVPDAGWWSRRLARLRRQRREILGERLDQAFYGADRLREDAELERLRLLGDAQLSLAEKQARLQQLEQSQLAQDPARRQQQAASSLEAMTADLERAHADPATRHAIRRAVWGGPAADRLARLDQERERWRQRLALYRQARREIASAPGLQPAQRQAALSALEQAGFSPQERLRLQALDGTALPAQGRP